ncbi:MAG: hypothetical protein AAFQ94_28925 [Bacteroidota bacterium]
MKVQKNDLLFYLAIVAAIWYALTSSFWFFLLNLIYALPFGLMSLLIWLFIRKDLKKRNKWIPRILIFGTALSAISLFAMYFFNN